MSTTLKFLLAITTVLVLGLGLAFSSTDVANPPETGKIPMATASQIKISKVNGVTTIYLADDSVDTTDQCIAHQVKKVIAQGIMMSLSEIRRSGNLVIDQALAKALKVMNS